MSTTTTPQCTERHQLMTELRMHYEGWPPSYTIRIMSGFNWHEYGIDHYSAATMACEAPGMVVRVATLADNVVTHVAIGTETYAVTQITPPDPA